MHVYGFELLPLEPATSARDFLRRIGLSNHSEVTQVSVIDTKRSHPQSPRILAFEGIGVSRIGSWGFGSKTSLRSISTLHSAQDGRYPYGHARRFALLSCPLAGALL